MNFDCIGMSPLRKATGFRRTWLTLFRSFLLFRFVPDCVLLCKQVPLTRKQCLFLVAAGSLSHFFLDHLFEVMSDHIWSHVSCELHFALAFL